MKNFKKLIGIFLLLITMHSCWHTVNIKSIKEEDYNVHVFRIYILVQKIEKLGNIPNEFKKNLQAEFDTSGVKYDIDFFEVNTLDLNPTLPELKIADFHPDVILLINFTGGTYQDGILKDLNIVSTIIDANNKKPVWKAELTTRGYGLFAAVSVAIPKIVRKLYTKLHEDGILE